MIGAGVTGGGVLTLSGATRKCSPQVTLRCSCPQLK